MLDYLENVELIGVGFRTNSDVWLICRWLLFADELADDIIYN